MADDTRTAQQKVQETRLAIDLEAERETNRQLAAELADLRIKTAPVAEPKVLRDPYDSQNPLTILKQPVGFVLSWKNPVYREGHRGWRGWVPVTHSGPIGKKIHEYLTDPPRKLAVATDDLVRRGDSVLCAIPEEMWLARQQRRTDKAAHQRAGQAGDEKTDQASQRVLNRTELVDPNSIPGRSMTS